MQDTPKVIQDTSKVCKIHQKFARYIKSLQDTSKVIQDTPKVIQDTSKVCKIHQKFSRYIKSLQDSSKVMQDTSKVCKIHQKSYKIHQKFARFIKSHARYIKSLQDASKVIQDSSKKTLKFANFNFRASSASNIPIHNDSLALPPSPKSNIKLVISQKKTQQYKNPN
jgi:GTP1/Obg family GTP-binding protein